MTSSPAHLLLWAYSARGFVEQAHRWLCHPAVMPISPIAGETWEYLPANVLRTIDVRVGDRLTRLADVRATLGALAVIGESTCCTRFRRVAFVYTLNADAAFCGFVFQHLGEAVERPSVQVQVTVVVPIGILADVLEVAYGNRPDIPGSALRHDVRRDGVQEVGAALVALVVQSPCLL